MKYSFQLKHKRIYHCPFASRFRLLSFWALWDFFGWLLWKCDLEGCVLGVIVAHTESEAGWLIIAACRLVISFNTPWSVIGWSDCIIRADIQNRPIFGLPQFFYPTGLLINRPEFPAVSPKSQLKQTYTKNPNSALQHYS